jgi:hypothetical protein
MPRAGFETVIPANKRLQTYALDRTATGFGNNNNNNNNNNNIAIPSDNNVIQKYAEEKLKYSNKSIEIQRMWNMKCFVIPVIIGTTGIVSRSLQKYLKTIPGQHSIDSPQKTAILGTSHVMRKVLQTET